MERSLDAGSTWTQWVPVSVRLTNFTDWGTNSWTNTDFEATYSTIPPVQYPWALIPSTNDVTKWSYFPALSNILMNEKDIENLQDILKNITPGDAVIYYTPGGTNKSQAVMVIGYDTDDDRFCINKGNSVRARDDFVVSMDDGFVGCGVGDPSTNLDILAGRCRGEFAFDSDIPTVAGIDLARTSDIPHLRAVQYYWDESVELQQDVSGGDIVKFTSTDIYDPTYYGVSQTNVTVTNAGFYRISANVSAFGATGTRTTMRWYLRTNGVKVAGSQGWTYHRTHASGNSLDSYTITKIVSLGGEDFIDVWGELWQGSGPVYTTNGCSLLVEGYIP